MTLGDDKIPDNEITSFAFYLGSKAYYDRRLGLAWDVLDGSPAREEFDLGYSYAEWKSQYA